MANKRKTKRPFVAEDWPKDLDRDDFEFARKTFSIFKYQEKTLLKKVKETGRNESEVIRIALDALFYHKRRNTDFEVVDGSLNRRS